MTDENKKKAFEEWCNTPQTQYETDMFYEDGNDFSRVTFYAGIRAAERLAKIEVLDKLYKYYNMEDGVLRHLDIKRDDLLYDIDKRIDELKAGR